MTHLIIFILMQFGTPPPPVTPQPVIDPCENMLPYDGALLPDAWALPDGTTCTPIEDDDGNVDPYGQPPAPVVHPQADPLTRGLMNALLRARRGW